MDSQKTNSPNGGVGDIKIRVKSASHRCEDITITSKLSDSVKRVKEIIKEHYPLHPETEEQRLIYAGQLLEDQQILSDIFSQPGQSSIASGGFTVHLACNSTFLRKANKAMNEENKSTKESQSTTKPPEITPPSQGLPNAVPAAGVPQDILALHSLYVQQMMHFMAQWGPGNNVPMHGSWGPVTNPQLTTGFNQFNYLPPNNLQQPQFVPFQNNPPPAVQEPAVNQNQPVVAPRVIEDDEQHPRDLLDWMYTISRLIIILSVVYFYSNFTRFILVIIFTALVFVFQRRANLRDQEQAAQRNRQPAQVPAQPVPPAADVPQAPAQENATQAGPVAGNPSEPSPVEDIIPEAQVQQQQQAQRFHLLDISRTFLTTFFTSLIPEMHPN